MLNRQGPKCQNYLTLKFNWLLPLPQVHTKFQHRDCIVLAISCPHRSKCQNPWKGPLTLKFDLWPGKYIGFFLFPYEVYILSLSNLECIVFSHTQWVSVTLAITLCPSSLASSAAAWTFLVFRLLLSNRYTDLLQILCGCYFGGLLLSLLKSCCYPYFSWNLG